MRETKQDRIIRGMLDQVTEHLHELKLMESNPNTKESDVEVWAQGLLKNCLGYMASSGYAIRAQEAKGKHRPDLIVMKNDKPILIVEVKKFGFNLNKSDFRSGKVQVAEYVQALGNVKWGILTNGTEWKLFDFSNASVGGIEIATFDLKEDDKPIDTSKRAVEEFCYEMFDFHEATYSHGSWPELSKEATVFSPESLAKALLSIDVIKYVAKSIRGEHEYKANLDVLTERVHDLVVSGLDDAVAGWNEVKALELQKFVKGQKRLGRKGKKTKSSLQVNEDMPKPGAMVGEKAEISTDPLSTSGGNKAS